MPLSGASGSTQYVQAQYVLRDNGEVIVVMAVALHNTPGLDNTPQTLAAFGLADVASGAALARYLDRTVVQCERSVAERGAVDFLFVIDDSGSMSTSQNRLAAAGTAMADALSNSSLDWRVALVTSSYHITGSPNSGIIRGFTENVHEFQAWLTKDSTCLRRDTGTTCTSTTQSCACGVSAAAAQLSTAPSCTYATGNAHGANSGCWIGENGSGYEGMLGAARLALIRMNEASPGDRIRLRSPEEAEIVVIILSDTEDQTKTLYHSDTTQLQNNWENIQHFIDFFQGNTTTVPTTTTSNGSPVVVPPVRPGNTIQVNAIYCPEGLLCGGAGELTLPTYPDHLTRIERVVFATGGTRRPINNGSATANAPEHQAAVQEAMREIVDNAIGSQGIETQKPLIGASLRVAVENPIGACANNADVPRSRVNGFDYNGLYRTVNFFGNCRPNDQSHVVISYRAWETSKEPLPCEEDMYFDRNTLECSGSRTCDTASNACVCPSSCGGCPAGMECNADIRICKCTSKLN